MVSEASTNGGSDNEGTTKLSGYFEFDSVSNSLCSFKVSSEKAYKMPVCNKEFQKQSLFRPLMQGGTQLVENIF